MIKNFDQWNECKKRIHADGISKLYHQREVWWCAFGTNIGFEQDGTGKAGDRPALIVKGFSSQVCLVIPLTTSIKKNPYHIALGTLHGRDSFAIISQLRLIDTKRLINKIGYISQGSFETIRKTIKDLL